MQTAHLVGATHCPAAIAAFKPPFAATLMLCGSTMSDHVTFFKRLTVLHKLATAETFSSQPSQKEPTFTRFAVSTRIMLSKSLSACPLPRAFFTNSCNSAFASMPATCKSHINRHPATHVTKPQTVALSVGPTKNNNCLLDKSTSKLSQL